MKKLLLTLSVTMAAVATTGCSWLNPGEEEFACSGMPGSVFCHSAREVYNRTNDGTVPSPIRTNTYNPDCKDCVRAEDENPDLAAQEVAHRAAINEDGAPVSGSTQPTYVAGTYKRKTLDVTDDEVINNYVTPNLPHRPVPVRTPSQVMRIWVGPYVDKSGDLVAPGIVYTEIEPRKWIYPDNEKGLNNRVMTPLQDRSQYTAMAGYDASGLGGANNAGAGSQISAPTAKSEREDQDQFSALKNYKNSQRNFAKRLAD